MPPTPYPYPYPALPCPKHTNTTTTTHAALQSEVDLASVVIRSKPFSDKEELLPVCWRCSTTNPLLNTQGDYCINCGAPFIR